MDADATESGACTNVCHTNKNDISRPHRSGPYASRRKTYVPPAFGIAAPSSDHTKASSVARSAPASHAMRACGPPIARITRELTTNGPIPTISIMFRSEEHTSELQSHLNLVCRLLLEKKKKRAEITSTTRWHTESRT